MPRGPAQGLVVLFDLAVSKAVKTASFEIGADGVHVTTSDHAGTVRRYALQGQDENARWRETPNGQ